MFYSFKDIFQIDNLHSFFRKIEKLDKITIIFETEKIYFSYYWSLNHILSSYRHNWDVKWWRYSNTCHLTGILWINNGFRWFSVQRRVFTWKVGSKNSCSWWLFFLNRNDYSHFLLVQVFYSCKDIFQINNLHSFFEKIEKLDEITIIFETEKIYFWYYWSLNHILSSYRHNWDVRWWKDSNTCHLTGILWINNGFRWFLVERRVFTWKVGSKNSCSWWLFFLNRND